MMISDGFGPASETYARQYHMWREQLSPTFMLPLDHIHVGQSRTQSSSSLITDSAAGATGKHVDQIFRCCNDLTANCHLPYKPFLVV